MKNKKIKNLVLLAMFIAIELAMISIPFLGYIPIGPMRATTLHIPVLIAAIVLGKKNGMIIGLVFGLSSLFYNTISPTITSFVFSPFISKNILSAFIAIVPRVCIGYICSILFTTLNNKMKSNYAIFISSFIASLANTVLVLGGIYILFGQTYANAINISYTTLQTYLLSIVATQGLLEAFVGSLIACFVVKPLMKVVGK